MCDCNNIEIGSYDNQVELKSWWNNKIICVDKCLQKEILNLWDNVVRTTGCCCGHNQLNPMINVILEHHNIMVKLGYKYYTNEHGVICYTPLTNLNNRDESTINQATLGRTYCRWVQND